QILFAGIFTTAAGVVFMLARRKALWWGYLAVGLVVIDLAIATWHFFPQANPALLDVKPDLVHYLESQPDQWRLTTFIPHGDSPLHANTPWLYEFQDVRGYDSIILKQYAQYMGAVEPQEDLLYNRIQPIKNWSSLNSPLLDLLNVKYIISSEKIELPKLSPVWEGDGLIVYENLAAAPRAFTLPSSATVVAADPLSSMAQYDPRSFVIVEGMEGIGEISGEPSPGALAPAEITEYGSQEVFIDVAMPERGWLVLADSYFPGWKAFARPQACYDCDEIDLAVTRVDGNFRGVLLETGSWTVRFKYSPLSFKVGLFLTFLAGATVLFSIGVWFWRFAYKESEGDSSIRRVAKNSLAPMCLNLFNRGIDFALAALAMRILGAENAGKYYVAINIAGWFEILANFGLNTLLTREVAKDKSQANRYLVNTTILRFITGMGAAVPIALYIIALGSSSNPLASDTTLAIVLIIIGMIPGGINTGLTALFYAYEKAEIPAALSTVSTILKVSLQAAALLAGLGFLGMATVSIVVNLVAMVLLSWLAFKTFFVPHKELDWSLQKRMAGESFPLMLNHLLATLFFRVDVLLLERLGGVGAINGNTVVGWYSTAFKWVDALNIIPSFFTTAIFPFLSRQADSCREAMKGTYELAIKLLVMIALPTAVLTTGIAHLLVKVLGGSEYLPHGAIALQILIWSIPIGWINSITNYVLIALGQQHKLTRAFVLGVGFNLAANIIFLPRYSYPAAAVIAILSELVLLMAFNYYLRKSLAPIPWLKILWRPFVATTVMAATTWAGWQVHWSLGILAGVAVYLGLISFLGALSKDEQKLLLRLLPDSIANGRFGRLLVKE
ncbi:MAG: flippase, partial [Anaerolineales bacterium]|nr:flippase [Anaerolineales bacterium]